MHWVRHGEALHNVRGEFASNKLIRDPWLTPKGEEQAIQLGTELDQKFDLVIVSPMRRTIQTALLISQNAVVPQGDRATKKRGQPACVEWSEVCILVVDCVRRISCGQCVTQ